MAGFATKDFGGRWPLAMACLRGHMLNRRCARRATQTMPGCTYVVPARLRELNFLHIFVGIEFFEDKLRIFIFDILCLLPQTRVQQMPRSAPCTHVRSTRRWSLVSQKNVLRSSEMVACLAEERCPLVSGFW